MTFSCFETGTPADSLGIWKTRITFNGFYIDEQSPVQYTAVHETMDSLRELISTHQNQWTVVICNQDTDPLDAAYTIQSASDSG